MPVMELPKNFPTDVDYDAYIDEAKDLQVEVGYAGKDDRAGVNRTGQNLEWDM
jgi:hypothetical protein